jgi:hypothetical protein
VSSEVPALGNTSATSSPTCDTLQIYIALPAL